MKLPEQYLNYKEWVLIGPMGPELVSSFNHLPSLAVDGGAQFCQKIDVWVGDSDSNSTLIKADSTFLYPSQKSESDMALALKLISPLNPHTLHFWGFTGGRFDHAIINLGETFHFLESCTITTATYYNHQGKIATRLFSKGRFQFVHHGLFSVIVAKPTLIMMSGQCEYQLKESSEIKPFSSLGLSNYAHGGVCIETSGPLAVIFPEMQ